MVEIHHVFTSFLLSQHIRLRDIVSHHNVELSGGTAESLPKPLQLPKCLVLSRSLCADRSNSGLDVAYGYASRPGSRFYLPGIIT